MTVPKKPARAKKAPARVVPKQNKTALGQTITDATGNHKTKYNDAIRTAARSLWEGDMKITIRQVADEMNIPYATVSKWCKGGDTGNGPRWVKSTKDMSVRAHAVADNYRGKLSELGPEISGEQQQQVADSTSDEAAVELRAKVLERHRKEWNAPRTISYEAIKDKNFDRMKQAKITAETLKIIQDGERKAWGIDSGPDGTKVQVVIERE